jgi:hypothetical protein
MKAGPVQSALLLSFCHRQTIGDLIMNRNSNGLRWEFRHPFTGKFYGNFCRAKTWYGEPKTVYVNQFLRERRGIPLVVQDFNFQDPEFVIGPENPQYDEFDKEVYEYRFAIRELEQATAAIRDYVQNPENISASVEYYLANLPATSYSRHPLSPNLYKLCFQHALQWAFSRTGNVSLSPVSMLIAL